jgi:hypothetical protein
VSGDELATGTETGSRIGTGIGVDGVQLGWTESTEVHEDGAKPRPQCTGTGTVTPDRVLP